jgi:hypothetical protein
MKRLLLWTLIYTLLWIPGLGMQYEIYRKKKFSRGSACHHKASIRA